jgi:hypothetical protein
MPRYIASDQSPPCNVDFYINCCFRIFPCVTHRSLTLHMSKAGGHAPIPPLALSIPLIAQVAKTLVLSLTPLPLISCSVYKQTLKIYLSCLTTNILVQIHHNQSTNLAPR